MMTSAPGYWSNPHRPGIIDAIAVRRNVLGCDAERPPPDLVRRCSRRSPWSPCRSWSRWVMRTGPGTVLPLNPEVGTSHSSFHRSLQLGHLASPISWSGPASKSVHDVHPRSAGGDVERTVGVQCGAVVCRATDNDPGVSGASAWVLTTRSMESFAQLLTEVKLAGHSCHHRPARPRSVHCPCPAPGHSRIPVNAMSTTSLELVVKVNQTDRPYQGRIRE